MSSAAVQQQQTSGPALQNYQQQQPPPPSPPSSQHRNPQYYALPSPVAASSPADSRKPSRRPSAHANGALPTQSAPSPAHYSPQPPQGSSYTSSPRSLPMPGPEPHMAHAAGALQTGAPMPPPRTSSHRSAQQERESSNNAQAQARRRTKDSPQQPSSSRAKASPGQPGHSRSATAIGETGLPREESTVINRIVVADPQEDIAREEARQAEARPATSGADLTPITGLGLVGSEGVDDGGRGAGKSRQDHPKTERRSKFGNYILGQTLGEGEFGKVKMGWKKDSSVEVAIKLIRRETLGNNQNRLAKIYREIQILRGLEHPNIVRLHEMVETERHIGIILEYASGGELFDYILNHRYLKDGAARRLFAQLISGVGYLHKKGIVHRDLKLENLLLDRNRNIIITDFGFANTFNPNDELGEEIEYKLGDKEWVRRMGLEGTDGNRRGDLMQTSCGSPCYAAPELVVSDSLYTGRKVDVWSCGVILYAMLAGYLPFDDDPANPEGDNINLLYKYIVSTPLTFPEYVTPHARDLLKRILVPDPRKRADLFEVARHSWLSDYAHVVSFITSSTTTSKDIAKTTVLPKEDVPTLARSASVREPGKPHTAVTPVGGLTAKRDQINRSEPSDKNKTSRDNKRRTVQVEYVAPQSQTVRGEASPPHAAAGASKARAREAGPTEVPPTDGYQSSSANARQRPGTAGNSSNTGNASARPIKEPQRSMSDYTAFGSAPMSSAVRPSTGGTLGGSRLPSRGNSYGQPAAATVAQTNAEGRFSQPKGRQYSITGPLTPNETPVGESIGQLSTQRMPPAQAPEPQSAPKGHRRSNTVSETLGRVTSMFSGRQPHDPNHHSNHTPNKIQKSYPPTSMTGPISNQDGPGPRPSHESSRRTSFGFNRKNTDQQQPGAPKTRRFSLIPSSLSKTFSNSREKEREAPSSSGTDRRTPAAQGTRQRTSSRPVMGYGRDSRSPSRSTTGSNVPAFYDGQHESNSRIRAGSSSAPAQQTQFNNHAHAPQQPLIGDDKFPGPSQPHPAQTGRDQRPYNHANTSEGSQSQLQTPSRGPARPQYPAGFNSGDVSASTPQSQRDRPGVLQKSRRFADAYEDPKQGHHSGSSGSAKRVMDLFRRLGRQRAKEDR